jgi:hypothetical protein
MNKIPVALKLGHRKGFVALDPFGVRAIAQGNALCHRVFLPPSPARYYDYSQILYIKYS